MEFITGLLENLRFPFLTLFVPAFTWAFWWVGGLWNQPERKGVVIWLKYDRSRHLYRYLITRALNALSAFFGRWEVRTRAGPEWDEAEILERNKRSWSWGLLDFALLIAVAYPIVSIASQWSILGEGKFGTLVVLPPADISDRWLPLSLLIGTSSAYVCAIVTKVRVNRGFLVLSVAFYICFIFQVEAFAFGIAFLGTGAIAIAAAFTGFFAGAGAGVVACLGAVAGAVVVAVSGAGVIAASVLGAVGIPGAVAAERIREKLERRLKWPALALLCWLSVMLLGLLIVSVWSQTTIDVPVEDISAVLLFIGFLPILNAVADFASTGLTRYLLARGAAGHPGWFGLVDIVAGVVTFFGLGFAMIGTVALVKAIGGPELIDLGVLLGPRGIPGAILTEPHAYWWLYVTFLSTLLPTVIHGFIATFSFVVMWPERLRMWLATSLESGSYVSGRPACLALAALIALSVALPLTLLYYFGLALAVYYPHAGETLIQIFRWFAGLTGAI